jgi:hypothetical protein
MARIIIQTDDGRHVAEFTDTATDDGEDSPIGRVLHHAYPLATAVSRSIGEAIITARLDEDRHPMSGAPNCTLCDGVAPCDACEGEP